MGATGRDACAPGAPMTSTPRNVLIIGGDGEFGRFLRHDILPHFEPLNIAIVERNTSRGEHADKLKTARHVILATPLAGYAELACEEIYRCRELQQRTTLWLLPSVQAGVWRAVSATLELVANPRLSAVFVHPMYGPNGFRETEPEAGTFQNVLTATYAGTEHQLDNEIGKLINAFEANFNISTTNTFDPDQHDQVTAYSQGLSYCVAKLMFQKPELERIIREQLPDLHRSFSANHDLIIDFLRINSYMPQVSAAFADAWQHTDQETYRDIIVAFARADASLNRGAESPISTKWYEKLRAAAIQIEDHK
jgi:prephenate dehydrogenase